ncbi:hypothetical protein RND81_02G033800 [Saponaria officinalis]|uniref:SHSP domain-containing protein n=1 Tax=Saponaria officinalis TaxID=3572 RepID=A0AAW1MTC5_SAPOF
MSLIPWNNNSNSNNTVTSLTTFPEQHLWDSFFSSPFPFPSFLTPFSGRTVPYSQLALETSGTVSAKLECIEVEAAHLIVAEIPGFEKHQVNVTAEEGEGGFVRVSGDGGEGTFSWRVRMPRDACLQMMSWSVENGVLTVVVPKVGVGVDYFMGGGFDWGNSQRVNVRQIDIQGDD